MTIKKLTCGNCEGKGWVQINGVRVTCEACLGYGYIEIPEKVIYGAITAKNPTS